MNKSRLKRLVQVKNRKMLIICAALLVIWIILMLILSSQNGTQTAQVSGGLSAWITRLIFGNSATQAEYSAVHIFIRKAAHLFLYAVQAVLLAEITACFENVGILFCTAVSVSLSSLFALADELHKLFISGRHFDMFDVMLNIIGAAIGAAAFFLIHYILQRRKLSEKSQKEQNKN